MAERVHGHEVMAMMVESGTGYTRESLRAAIVERFGPDTRFYTCSADRMTPDELITFLRRAASSSRPGRLHDRREQALQSLSATGRDTYGRV